MHLLLFFLTAFWLNIADPAAIDADDLIFPIGNQPLDSNFLWNDPGVDLESATGGLGYDFSADDDLGPLDDASHSGYLGYDDDMFMSTMDENEQPRFGSESVCSTIEESTMGNRRRENQCPGPTVPSPNTENHSGSTEEGGSNKPEPQPEPEPLSTSLLGVPFNSLCPPNKVPGRVPLCCEGRPYREFVSNCINCEFALLGGFHHH